MDNAQYQRYDEMYTLVEQLEPKTAEDHLFLGLSLSDADPVRALRILDGAPRAPGNRPSPGSHGPESRTPWP